MQKLIFLIGVVGAGKSIVAKELSKLGYTHLTIDHYYLTTPRTKKGIFYLDRAFVEEAWRRLREDILKTLQGGKKIVFESTGTDPHWARLFKRFRNKMRQEVCLVSVTSPIELIHKRILERNKAYVRRGIPIRISRKVLDENLEEFRAFSFKPDYEIVNARSKQSFVASIRSLPFLSRTCW